MLHCKDKFTLILKLFFLYKYDTYYNKTEEVLYKVIYLPDKVIHTKPSL